MNLFEFRFGSGLDEVIDATALAMMSREQLDSSFRQARGWETRKFFIVLVLDVARQLLDPNHRALKIGALTKQAAQRRSLDLVRRVTELNQDQMQ